MPGVGFVIGARTKSSKVSEREFFCQFYGKGRGKNPAVLERDAGKASIFHPEKNKSLRMYGKF